MATKTQRMRSVQKGAGFKEAMRKRNRRATAEGRPLPCQCWECIRADGLTPPLSEREKHAARYPHTVFAKDEGGEPVATAKRKSDEHKVGGSEQRHLREAVRNRSAI